ncbi:MAG: PRC-barrel domain-containing protein [Steroidobacteraceae bacterium]
MKIFRDFTCTAALVMVLTALSPSTSTAQAVEIVKVDVMAVGLGYRVSKLIGRDVINEQSEEIGEIDDFIIGRDRVLFVILEVGGFLGIGAHLVALPATAIDLETVKGKVLIKQASRAQLSKMPKFNYGKDQGAQQKSSGDSR